MSISMSPANSIGGVVIPLVAQEIHLANFERDIRTIRQHFLEDRVGLLHSLKRRPSVRRIGGVKFQQAAKFRQSPVKLMGAQRGFSSKPMVRRRHGTKLQQALVDYEPENSIADLGNKENILKQRLADLSKDLTAAQTDRANKHSVYEDGEPPLRLCA